MPRSAPPDTPDNSEINAEIRSKMRHLRNSIEGADAAAAAAEIARKLAVIPAFINATRLAAYIAVNGETDTTPLIRQARDANKQPYLPVVGDNYRLLFAPYSSDATMLQNRYHIPEPAHTTAKLLHASDLDIVCVPLLAFDSDCRRLGSGAGYYDRALAHTTPRQPLKIGVAYDFQRVDCLTAQAWDIPMDIIITEKTIYTRPETTGGSE
jgi:5-formyltetrahydrofolate cyclo-ligase